MIKFPWKTYFNIIPLIILIIIIWWVGKGLWFYEFNSTHDGLHHISRSYDAVVSIEEGHLPLRWAGSLNYWCGVAVYNFFYPLIYYVVYLINLVVNDVIKSVTWVSWGSLVVAGLGFYWWIRIETKNNWWALAGSLAYLLAPYRFLLVYVRGSPEYMSYALMPIYLGLLAKTIESKSIIKLVSWGLVSSVVGGLFVLSHNFTVMFLLPLVGIYVLVKLWNSRNGLTKLKTGLVIFCYLSSLGIGSFFLGPMILEMKNVQLSNNSVVNYKDHFPTLGQIIKSPWGYFYSMPGVENDGESFMLGYGQWLILIIAVFWLIWRLIRDRFRLRIWLAQNWIGVGLLIAIVFVIYLILPWSMWIWNNLKFLQMIQFSWRLLGVVVFLISGLWVWLLFRMPKVVSLFLLLLVSLVLVYGNRNHLNSLPINIDDQKLFLDYDRLHYHRHSTTTLGNDVIGVESQVCDFGVPLVVDENGSVVSYEKIKRGNTFGEIVIDRKDLVGNKVILGLEYFPGIYKLKVNDLHLEVEMCGGRVCLNNLPEIEKLKISWQIVQSPIQNFFNIISLGFLFVWISFVLITLWKK